MNRSQWILAAAFVVVLAVVASIEVWADDPVAQGLFDSGEAPGTAPVTSSQAQPSANEAGTRDFCRCLCEQDPAAVNRIEQVLNSPLKPAGVDYTDTPLLEVVMDLSQQYGVPIQLDDTALEEIGLSSEEKITAALNNISLNSALRLMLKRLNLTYLIKDEVLLITTEEEAEREMQTCIYDVRHLVDKNTPTRGGASGSNYEPLIGAITSCIQPETWKAGEGTGDVRALSPGFLVVLQTRAVHDQVSDFLKSLREMREAVPFGEPAKRY